MTTTQDKPWLKHYEDKVPTTLSYPEIPLFRLFEEAANRYPDSPCTIFKDNIINYSRMNQLINNLTAGLIDMGLKKGERVGLSMPNIPQFILAYFAILKAGGVVVAINPTYKEQETTFQLKDSGATFLIGLKTSQELFSKIKSNTNLKKIILTEIEDALQLNNPAKNKPLLAKDQTEYSLIELLQYYADSPPPQTNISADDPAIFQYSGGTTGIPKAAIGLHRNLVANTIQFRTWQTPLKDGQESVLIAIPLFHVYGMVVAMSVGIYLGASLVLIPNPRDIQDILQNIQKYHTTAFPGVPNMYHAIGNHPDVLSKKYDLSSIKACISGSAPLLRVTKEKFESVTGGKVAEGYGLSEAPTATHCNPILGENRTGSIGLPLPDVECRIINLEDEKTELPVGEVGELIIKGPQIMQGYHNMPEETHQTLRDGWLYTGDIAKMDKDGYVYLVDRKKDLIKPGGLQVWPREVEEVIASHPAVLEVGVAGVSHPEYGETVKAWIVTHPGQSVAPSEIIDWCKAKLANYKAPRQVEFIDQLPRTTVGKLLRRELVKLHNDSQ